MQIDGDWHKFYLLSSEKHFLLFYFFCDGCFIALFRLIFGFFMDQLLLWGMRTLNLLVLVLLFMNILLFGVFCFSWSGVLFDCTFLVVIGLFEFGLVFGVF